MMKNSLFLSAALAALFLLSCERNDIPQMENPETPLSTSLSQSIEGKYVVLFEDQGTLKSASVNGQVAMETVAQVSRDLFADMAMPTREPEFIYNSAFRGIAVEMTAEEAARLSAAPGVKGVYQDILVSIDLPKVVGKPVVSADVETNTSILWGVARVGGGSAYTGTAKAWIIDTGIDYDHPDLNVATSLGVSFVKGIKTADDDHGHGTHCAGIVAAISNGIGVKGVAAGAAVVPVKVMSRKGTGPMSAILAGVNYVAENATPGDAVNISLSGGAYEPLDLGVIALGQKGVKIAIAAGNSSASAAIYSPARANGVNVYTVSAMGKGDAWASFSNYGNPPVDFCAPGVSIYSTYMGGTYSYMSGTSMAAPHVCGILLLQDAPVTDGYVIGDRDATPDPIAHI